MELGDCHCPLCCCCCSVAQLCPTLYDPMDCSTPAFPILHHLPELAQTHVHWVGGAIQPSCSLSSPSPLWEVPKYCATPQITDPRVFPPSFNRLQGSFHETINENWERGVNIAAVHGTLAISCVSRVVPASSYICHYNLVVKRFCACPIMTCWVRHTQFMMSSSLLHGSLVVHGQIFSLY